MFKYKEVNLSNIHFWAAGFAFSLHRQQHSLFQQKKTACAAHLTQQGTAARLEGSKC